MLFLIMFLGVMKFDLEAKLPEIKKELERRKSQKQEEKRMEKIKEKSKEVIAK